MQFAIHYMGISRAIVTLQINIWYKDFSSGVGHVEIPLYGGPRNKSGYLYSR